MVQVRDSKDRLVGTIPSSLFNEIKRHDVLRFSGKHYKVLHRKWDMVNKGDGDCARILKRVVEVSDGEG